MGRVVVDVGTGDGNFVVHTATAEPGAVVLGLDPDLASLRAGFSRARRKRLANAHFVVAAAEDPPPELAGIAHEVRVQFPWAGLLHAIIAADPVVVGNLGALVRPGGRLWVALSIVPRDGLPVESLDQAAAASIARRLALAGSLRVRRVDALGTVEARQLHSTWAKRLGVGRTRPGWLLELERPVAADRPAVG